MLGTVPYNWDLQYLLYIRTPKAYPALAHGPMLRAARSQKVRHVWNSSPLPLHCAIRKPPVRALSSLALKGSNRPLGIHLLHIRTLTQGKAQNVDSNKFRLALTNAPQARARFKVSHVGEPWKDSLKNM